MSYGMCAAGHLLGKWKPIRPPSSVSHNIGSEGLGGWAIRLAAAFFDTLIPFCLT